MSRLVIIPSWNSAAPAPASASPLCGSSRTASSKSCSARCASFACRNSLAACTCASACCGSSLSRTSSSERARSRSWRAIRKWINSSRTSRRFAATSGPFHMPSSDAVVVEHCLRNSPLFAASRARRRLTSAFVGSESRSLCSACSASMLWLPIASASASASTYLAVLAIGPCRLSERIDGAFHISRRPACAVRPGTRSRLRGSRSLPRARQRSL